VVVQAVNMLQETNYCAMYAMQTHSACSSCRLQMCAHRPDGR
jgi:hypothetical protein